MALSPCDRSGLAATSSGLPTDGGVRMLTLISVLAASFFDQPLRDNQHFLCISQGSLPPLPSAIFFMLDVHRRPLCRVGPWPSTDAFTC